MQFFCACFTLQHHKLVITCNNNSMENSKEIFNISFQQHENMHQVQYIVLMAETWHEWPQNWTFLRKLMTSNHISGMTHIKPHQWYDTHQTTSVYDTHQTTSVVQHTSNHISGMTHIKPHLYPCVSLTTENWDAGHNQRWHKLDWNTTQM